MIGEGVIRQAVKMYKNGYTITEISKDLNISRQHLSIKIRDWLNINKIRAPYMRIKKEKAFYLYRLGLNDEEVTKTLIINRMTSYRWRKDWNALNIQPIVINGKEERLTLAKFIVNEDITKESFAELVECLEYLRQEETKLINEWENLNTKPINTKI